MKKYISGLFLLFCMFVSVNIAQAEVSAIQKNAPVQQPAASNANVHYSQVQSPVAVVNNPYMYLNKNIQFNAKFNKFSTLGLGYKPALREAQAYIGILVQRDDVGNNVIPLSEFKMFIKRTDAEKLTDLEAGDTVLIKGKVFSVALGDPWMDIVELKNLTPKKTNTTKTGK